MISLLVMLVEEGIGALDLSKEGRNGYGFVTY